MKKLFSITFMLLGLYACNSGQSYQANLERLDKIYGKCDNPYRTYREIEYKICKDNERAAGPDGEIGEALDINNLLSGFGKNRENIIVSADTNNFLWDASLKVMDNYSLKIIDYDGGFIETNWIMKEENINQRCLIKVHITSRELISNGVSNKIICETKKNGEWLNSKEEFLDAEKNLTLKILSTARDLSLQSPNS